ncbi:putative UPF0481 protein [Tanacetum coccineum]
MANVINNQDTIQILLGCEEGRNNISTSRFSSSISMVPSMLRNLSPKSFTPRVVSIGPLHHEDENLKEMEEQKRIYLHDLLIRVGFPQEQTLDECLQKVNASIDQIRARYIGMRPYSDVQLAKMMVMDSCFILEISYKFKLGIVNPLISQSTRLNLLLVENQIPFFVLNDIYECTVFKSDPTASLTDLILPVLEIGNPFAPILRKYIPSSGAYIAPDHILGLYHKCYQPAEGTIASAFIPSIIHDTLELVKVGVSFKPYQDASWRLAMKLERSRFAWFSWLCGKPIVIKMPTMCINHFYELFARNLIAYEQTYDVGKYVSSYALAMDILIGGQEDIAKLVESKVIINIMGSNQEAAEVINSILKEVPVTDFYYVDVLTQLVSYHEGYWPKNIMWLRRRYFNSPWSIIALFAGMILFGLTVVQTIFTIKH